MLISSLILLSAYELEVFNQKEQTCASTFDGEIDTVFCLTRQLDTSILYYTTSLPPERLHGNPFTGHSMPNDLPHPVAMDGRVEHGWTS